MILNKNNLKKWKKNIDYHCKKMMPPEWQGLSKTLSNEEWLRDYIGEDSRDVVLDNLRCLIS